MELANADRLGNDVVLLVRVYPETDWVITPKASPQP